MLRACYVNFKCRVCRDEEVKLKVEVASLLHRLMKINNDGHPLKKVHNITAV